MLTNYPFLFLSGFILSWALVFFLKKFSSECNILIVKGIPRVGGLAVIGSFAALVLAYFFVTKGLTYEITGIVLASFMMFVFGVIDDCVELSVSKKFLVQIISAVILILFGVRTNIVYIGTAANILVTLVWILAVTNAFNHLDVMDGVAGGIALIAGLSFCLIAYLNHDFSMMVISLILSSAISGFIFFNLPPAKVYLGNSGSHLLGFILAAVALAISYAPIERKIALLSPILILGLPIFDTMFLILMRFSKKISIFKKSNDHLTMKFLKISNSPVKALGYICGLGVLFALSGVLVSKISNFSGAAVIILVILISLIVARNMYRVNVDG